MSLWKLLGSSGRTFVSPRSFVTISHRRNKMTFVEELRNLRKEEDQNKRNSKLYKDIEERVKLTCRRFAGYTDYCSISEFNFSDFSPSAYSNYRLPNNEGLEKIVQMVTSDLGLAWTENYISWRG